VLDQMETLVRRFGIEEFVFVDDVFNFDIERAKAVCRGIVERNLRVSLQFPNGLRGDRFDEELMVLMKRAGTHFIAVAIETVSKEYQRLIGKNLNIEKAMRTLQWARQQKIEVSGYFMIGFPGETLDQVKETVDFAVRAPFDAIFISIVTPFKGTVLRNDMLKGRFGNETEAGVAVLNGRFPVVRSTTLTPEVLRRIQVNGYWRFYSKPRPLMTLVKRLANVRNIRKVARAVRGRVRSRKVESVN
jgi:radical SAM superfamily enzyme